VNQERRRATRRAPLRDRGRNTRQRIAEAAAQLFTQRPLAEVSVSDIAAAAGVFPNQVTYYFGSKDALFIHAAFLALLHDAERLESVGLRMRTPESFRAAIARTVLVLPAVPVVVHALAIGSTRPELAGTVDHYLRLLFRRSEHYLADVLARRGWHTERPIGVETRTFWSTAFGAALLYQAGAVGRPSDLDLPGTLTIYCPEPAR
jgi:TetR/AcrR family transcriptional regulator, regulator of cefoperazone and chloramphenicol sensitivity